MVARPKLKLRGRHDLRLHTANVAANRNQVFCRLIEQMMAAETESVNLFSREGNVVRSFRCAANFFHRRRVSARRPEQLNLFCKHYS